MHISSVLWLRSFYFVFFYMVNRKIPIKTRQLSQMLCNFPEKQWAQRPHYLSKKTSLYSGFNTGQTNVIFPGLDIQGGLVRLYNKLDLPESSASLFASLMSPPVTGTNELIADTSLSYVCFLDVRMILFNKRRHRDVVVGIVASHQEGPKFRCLFAVRLVTCPGRSLLLTQ